MEHYSRLISLFICVFLLPGLCSCSVSYSLDKSLDSVSQSFDSISTSFGSISDSSKSGKDEAEAMLQHFREDINGLAENYIDQGLEGEMFERQIGQIAMRYGLVEWENETIVYDVVGKVLHRKGLDLNDFANLPLLQSELMAENIDLVIRGYRGA